MNKEELKRALKVLLSETAPDIAEENNDDAPGISALLQDILAEVKNNSRERETMREEIKSLKADLINKVTKLEETVQSLQQTAMHHQIYIEKMEHAKRSKNIFLTGIPESGQGDHDENHDRSKCEDIFSIVNASPEDIVNIKRLGRRSNETNAHRPRPILVEVGSQSIRDDICKNSKELKVAGDAYKRVFLKKDMHPLVRKEFKRLQEVRRKEQDKPENIGRRITYDAKRRAVLCDDQIIDRFQPVPF